MELGQSEGQQTAWLREVWKRSAMLKFVEDEDDERWRADLGKMVPWPKLRDIIEWLNQSDFKYGWFIETSGIADISRESRAHAYNVKISFDAADDRDIFEARWKDWF